MLLIPQMVEVRVTGLRYCEPEMSYHVEQIPLDEYVKGVLPNEWGLNWHMDSLYAGAVAVKQYAVAQMNGKGYVWDCNYDQVYRPSWRTERTDQAVDDTWDWWIWDDGLSQTYYDSWQYGCLSRHQYTNCLSQWSTFYSHGTWRSMLDVYQGELIKFSPWLHGYIP